MKRTHLFLIAIFFICAVSVAFLSAQAVENNKTKSTFSTQTEKRIERALPHFHLPKIDKRLLPHFAP